MRKDRICNIKGETSMKKNDFITLEIEDIGVGGEGIGKAEGVTFFVKDAIVGDVIEARITKLKKHYGYARLMKILKPSGKRKEAKCPVARQCGGCQIQEMDYGEQLKFKERKVRNNLERIGGFDRAFLGRVMEPICGMEEPFRYRNKAQYPIGTDREGYPVAGFYAGRTHQIIPNMVCALGKEINTQVLEVVLDFMREFQIPAYSEETGRGLLRHVLIRTGFHTGEIMVCFIVNGTRIPHTDELTGRLRKLPGMTSITMNINCDNTNVIMGKEIRLLWGKEYITDYIGEIKYQISPLSFYQVNPVQTEILYTKAIEYAGLTGKERIVDAYCGIGTIGLIAASKAKEVISVELNRDAVRDAVTNAKRNDIKNVQFYNADAGQFMVEMAEYRADQKKNQVPAATKSGKKATPDGNVDVVFMDPPRAGSDEAFLSSVIRLAPKRVVYISCNPETLARDLKYLTKHGYQAKECQPVDLFPWTKHVETIVLLQRGTL